MTRLGALLLAAAAAAGAGAGAIAGASYLDHGFALLFADGVRQSANQAVIATLGFLAGFALLVRPLERRIAPGRATALAAALAAAPWLGAAGWRANRAWGIRPAELLEPFALRRNLLLLGGMAALWLVLAWVLGKRSAGRGTSRATTALAAALVAALAAGNAAVAWAFGSRAPATPETPVLVLLIDALRADHVSAYGYDRPTTPAIDALARDGVLFRQAVSASTFTKSSIASLFTGRFPYQHGVYWGSSRENPQAVTSHLLAPRETTLAESLLAGGYLTAAWVQNSHLRHFMGFAQGFVDYRDQQGGQARINRLVSRWLGRAGRRYGFFAYLHYIDLHDPYRPEAPYDAMFGGAAGDPYAGIDLAEWGAFLEAVRRGERRLSREQVERFAALYDGQLRAIDEGVGRLLARLRELDLYDRSLIVLTADHGDGFMEHGFISHSTTPYEELVRVPLIVKLPRGTHAGTVVEDQVRLVDVMPTVLAAVGLPAPAGMAGCSLLPLLAGEGAARPGHCRDAVIEIAEDGASPVVAVRSAGFKYIHHERRPPELYDLAADPAERVNLAGEPGAEGERLRRLALAVLAERAKTQAERIELDERTIRELKALGYVD